MLHPKQVRQRKKPQYDGYRWLCECRPPARPIQTVRCIQNVCGGSGSFKPLAWIPTVWFLCLPLPSSPLSLKFCSARFFFFAGPETWFQDHHFPMSGDAEEPGGLYVRNKDERHVFKAPPSRVSLLGAFLTTACLAELISRLPHAAPSYA